MSFGNVFILGDSYSTFDGHIPADCAPWYCNGGHEQTDVAAVEQTWWWQLCQETQSHLLLNSSFSGTTICNTGYEQADCSDISFIARLDKLIKEGYFIQHKVDTLFIFGGTNDSWADSPIGELQYEGWTKTDLFSVLPAFCYLLHQAKTNLLNAKIIVVINTELKDAITKGMQTACQTMGIQSILLQDIAKDCGHPNILGMTQIKDQIIQHSSN